MRRLLLLVSLLYVGESSLTSVVLVCLLFDRLLFDCVYVCVPCTSNYVVASKAPPLTISMTIATRTMGFLLATRCRG